MPIYEYECVDCLHKFEHKQGFEDPPITKCPECGEKVHRVIHASPFFFPRPMYQGNPNIRQAPEGHWEKGVV